MMLSLIWFLVSLIPGTIYAGYSTMGLIDLSIIWIDDFDIKTILLYPLSIPIYTYLAAREKLNMCGAILAAVLVTAFFSVAVMLVAIIAYGIVLPGYLAVKLFCAIFAKRSD